MCLLARNRCVRLPLLCERIFGSSQRSLARSLRCSAPADALLEAEFFDSVSGRALDSAELDASSLALPSRVELW